MKSLIFVSDRFKSPTDYTTGVGGAELSDFALIEKLEAKGYKVIKILAQDFMDTNPGIPKILSNCAKLKHNKIETFQAGLPEYKISNYVMIHHDYQYLNTRNPWKQQSLVMIAMLSHLTNAKANFYQTDFHLTATLQNITPFITQNYNNIYRVNNPLSLKCTMFSDQELTTLSTLNKTSKIHAGEWVIVDSPNPIKGVKQTIDVAERLGICFELIKAQPQLELFNNILPFEGIVFFPETPETCCRLAVEVKALSRSVITSINYGASLSDWFKFKGDPLIAKIREMNEEAVNKIIAVIES